jgi:hypothetical protein
MAQDTFMRDNMVNRDLPKDCRRLDVFSDRDGFILATNCREAYR